MRGFIFLKKGLAGVNEMSPFSNWGGVSFFNQFSVQLATPHPSAEILYYSSLIILATDINENMINSAAS